MWRVRNIKAYSTLFSISIKCPFLILCHPMQPTPINPLVLHPPKNLSSSKIIFQYFGFWRVTGVGSLAEDPILEKDSGADVMSYADALRASPRQNVGAWWPSNIEPTAMVYHLLVVLRVSHYIEKRIWLKYTLIVTAYAQSWLWSSFNKWAIKNWKGTQFPSSLFRNRILFPLLRRPKLL
jgi:hypothetical protein